ncbi:outer membrane protein with beta-barrel domain [Aquimarina sp. MAR_2010_214]|uniref:porin family protein n=1 Tax=Aquimarina sp. MAR_2010_214 TaxID=1250026 RepID=UPI000C701524|nr:porin family protein [Aquimarina sp. MAR_2010_214]PKV51224.1 outer membrane protein with beta-barrel domain [Aquimarina sp. MAR_2010_214]
MRKLLFVVIATFSLGVTAQEENIRFGAKAGLNIANIAGDAVNGISSRTGFHLGAVVEIPISEKFAFQPEVLYSAQGYTMDETVFGIRIEGTTKLDYINIPLIAKYYVVKGLSIQAGPQVGFLVSAKGEVKTAGIEREEDIDDFYKSVDLGLGFGAGYQLDMGLFFDARYNLGLSDINDVDGDDDKNQNAVIQFSVGYKF